MKPHKLIKYVISGAISTVTNLGSFFILEHYFNIYYLYGSILSLLISTLVSFVLQKFWTFDDQITNTIYLQFILYVAITLGNLAINTAVVYILVDRMHIWYLLAQLTASCVVAITGFFAYQRFVFNKSA